MQVYVTHKVLKKKQFNFVRFAIFSAIAIVFALVIFLGFYLNSKHNQVFKQQTFYFVCAAKTKGTKELENMQDDVKTLGGAGKIYKTDNYNYLILNVYLDEEAAKEVLEKNREVYPNGVIFELKTNKIKDSIKRKVKNEETAYKFVKKFNSNIEEISELMFKYLSGSISENSLCSKILTIKFNLDDLSDEMKKIDNSEIGEVVKNYLNLELMYFSSFFNDFFDSDKKSSVVCDFMVCLSLLKIDFFNNL